jgi:DnaJ family protein B protein 6
MSGLYEELGVSKNATPEQVRKAYRKKALLTHPDRLPQGSTAEQKAISEEQFRKVNNAYEVLIDPKKRQEYDTHGVWPPPAEPRWSPTAPTFQGRWPPRSNTFPDPFMSHHTNFNFSDPFSLFDQIFAGTSFARSSRHRHPFFNQPFSPFGHMHMDIEDLLNEVDQDIFPTRGPPMFTHCPQYPAFPPAASSSVSSGNGTHWVSESYSSSMINGVAQSIHKRRDSEGNEHITRTLPDGRQVRTINGVEQPTRQHVTFAESNHSRQLPELTTNYLPPPYAAAQNNARNSVAPLNPYEPQIQNYHVRQSDNHGHRDHHHHSRDKRRRFSEDDEDPTSQPEKHARQKWWP